MRITPEKNSFKTKVLEENKLPSIFNVKRKRRVYFQLSLYHLYLLHAAAAAEVVAVQLLQLQQMVGQMVGQMVEQQVQLAVQQLI